MFTHTTLQHNSHKVFLFFLTLTPSFATNLQPNEQALLQATQRNNFDTVKTLLDQKTNPNITNHPFQETPLHISVIQGNLNITKLLLQHNAHINAQDYLNNTPLHWASYRNNPTMISLLITHSADKNLTNNFGDTPLKYNQKQQHNNFLDHPLLPLTVITSIGSSILLSLYNQDHTPKSHHVTPDKKTTH